MYKIVLTHNQYIDEKNKMNNHKTRNHSINESA